MKRRHKIALLLLAVAAFVVWLEPTRVVWGWLRGEAFYEGRPTSYWRCELSRWREWGRLIGPTTPDGEIAYFARSDGKFERWLADSGFIQLPHIRSITPPLLDGDPEALPVLQELSQNATPETQILVGRGIQRIRNKWQVPDHLKNLRLVAIP
jgi:hypothetical protein